MAEKFIIEDYVCAKTGDKGKLVYLGGRFCRCIDDEKVIKKVKLVLLEDKKHFDNLLKEKESCET